jgi:hypothetical protein
MKLNRLAYSFALLVTSVGCASRNSDPEGSDPAFFDTPLKREAIAILKENTNREFTGQEKQRPGATQAKCSLALIRKNNKDFVQFSWGEQKREIPWNSFQNAQSAEQIVAQFDLVAQLAIFYKVDTSQPENSNRTFTGFRVTPPAPRPATTFQCIFESKSDE